jgi:beta-1,4-mannosyltransferase
VGDPHPGQRASLETAAALDGRISLNLRFVDDQTLVREVSEASLVVLPYVEMKNSGALIVAASLRRPVLVPTSALNSALAVEFGDSWVRQFDGELTPDVVARALDAAEAELRGNGAPNLAGRDWFTIGTAHLRAYREALVLARRSKLARARRASSPEARQSH